MCNLKRDILYHAIHEAAHALVAWHFGLTPKQLRVGKMANGMDGKFDPCLPETDCWEQHQYLAITVAGRVGTQLLGYDNRLVSACLDDLQPGEEPPDFSDEWCVRDDAVPVDEVLAAEDEARNILSQGRTVLLALGQELAAKGEMGKDEIVAIIGGR